MVSCFIVHFVGISWNFICRDSWSPMLKMGSIRKNSCFCHQPGIFTILRACLWVYECGLDTPNRMNFDWQNHVITALWLWILIKDAPLPHPPHPMQFLSMQFYLPSFGKDMGWWWAGDWNVFTCVLYYTEYVALERISVSHVIRGTPRFCLPYVFIDQENQSQIYLDGRCSQAKNRFRII